MTEAIKLLQAELDRATEVRSGLGKAWHALKRDGNEDRYIGDMYEKFDHKVKDYTRALGNLQEAENKTMVATSA